MTQSLPQSQKIGLLVRVWSVCGPNGIRLSCFAWVPRMVDAGVPDVVVAPPATRRRLTGKRNLQTFCLWSLLPEEVADAHKSVCLVTLAHPTNSHSAEGIQLVAPGSVDRAGACQKLLAACARPRPDPHWAQRYPGRELPGTGVVMMAVFGECHAENAEALE